MCIRDRLWEELRSSGKAGTGAKMPTNGKEASTPPLPSVALLRHFLQERWKGLTAIIWGDQLRQERLDELIYLDTLGIDLLPQPAAQDQNSAGMVTSHPAIATEYQAD